MTWPNPDRAQLLALADADDAEPGQCSASARTYGHASSIETQPNSGGVRALVASRAKKMQFRSNEVRKRYLRVHRALSC